MARVRATCPRCGDVDLATSQVQMQVCDSTGVWNYSFQCPCCRLMVNKPAELAVVEALQGVDVRTVHWHLPAELAESKYGPPINHDDLLAFHLALADARWQDELADL